jgi:hypothetical protein
MVRATTLVLCTASAQRYERRPPPPTGVERQLDLNTLSTDFLNERENEMWT